MINKEKRKTIPELIDSYAYENKEDVQNSTKCGCFGCGKIIKSADITEFHGNDAICPLCGKQTIIPENQGVELNENVMTLYRKIIAQFPVTVK